MYFHFPPLSPPSLLRPPWSLLFPLQVGDVVIMKKPKHGLYPLIGLHSRGEVVCDNQWHYKLHLMAKETMHLSRDIHGVGQDVILIIASFPGQLYITCSTQLDTMHKYLPLKLWLFHVWIKNLSIHCTTGILYTLYCISCIYWGPFA